MGKGFIDKHNSVKYQLVHVPYQDSTAQEEYTFKEISKKEISKSLEKSQISHPNLENSGIYYSDDYDYMKHLKEISEQNFYKNSINLEENLRKDDYVSRNNYLDQEISQVLNALEEEAYLEEEENLQDFFNEISMDKETESPSVQKVSLDSCLEKPQKEMSEPLNEFSKNSQKNSLGSIMKRNSNLQILDSKFDMILEKEYEISESEDDYDENLNEITSDLEEIFEEFLDNIETIGKKKKVIKKREQLEISLSENLENLNLSQDSDSSDISLEEIPQKEEWDCETILSTFSNIYNRPRILKESYQTKISLNSLKKCSKQLQKENQEQFTENKDQEACTENLGSKRSKNETLQEKKERKQEIKSKRRERRAVKKATTRAFLEEKLRV